MGLFEHCEIMLKQDLIDEETFENIYGYRLDYLLKNQQVRRRLAIYGSAGKFDAYKESVNWTTFRQLLKRFGKLEQLKGPVASSKQVREELTKEKEKVGL